MKTTIDLFDHSLKQHVRIKRCDNHWHRFISKNKKKWVLTHTFDNMEDAIKFKDAVINNNYRNLFKIIKS